MKRLILHYRPFADMQKKLDLSIKDGLFSSILEMGNDDNAVISR